MTFLVNLGENLNIPTIVSSSRMVGNSGELSRYVQRTSYYGMGYPKLYIPSPTSTEHTFGGFSVTRFDYNGA